MTSMYNKIYILFFLFVLLASCDSKEISSINKNTMIKFSNPKELNTPKGYSHASVVDIGNAHMIFISGQVPIDAHGNIVGTNMKTQSKQVFENIASILKTHTATFNDVVKFTYFVKDITKIQDLRDVRDLYINKEYPPASTLVEVSNLFKPEILLEVEATAVVTKKNKFGK
jgi:2-iminobutanoate/2-iminopropanoate deaminase